MYSQEGCFELVKLSLGTRDLDNNGLFLSWHSFFQSKIFSCDDLESCGQISNMNMLEKPRFSLKKESCCYCHQSSTVWTENSTKYTNKSFLVFPTTFSKFNPFTRSPCNLIWLPQESLPARSQCYSSNFLQPLFQHLKNRARLLEMCVQMPEWLTFLYCFMCISYIMKRTQFFRKVQLEHSLRHNFYSLISESLI